jgi:hypothetical protein
LYPTYTQLQMVDRSLRWPEGIAKDVICSCWLSSPRHAER